MATGDKIYFVDEIVGALHPSVTKIETAYFSSGTSGKVTMKEATGKGVLYMSVPDQQSITYTITVDGVDVCTNAVLSYSSAANSALPISFNESIKVVVNSTSSSYIIKYTLVLY